MNIKENSVSSLGHPCRGCPYVFAGTGTGCIMAAVPGDCAWYFYKRMQGHPDAMCPKEKIETQYRRAVSRSHEAAAKLEKCREMLYVTAELKFGTKYAERLRRKEKNGCC